MEDTVKAFSVYYNHINNEGTFTGGDWISGNIKLELSKDCKINSLYVQIKGKANVLWTEQYGKTVVVYSSKEKFFTIKQSVIQEFKGQESQTVGRGCYAYPFNFQIPSEDLPPSFKSFTGKIRYRVKAYLSRSMSRDSKANAPFTVISKASCSPEMMIPQHSIKHQKLKLFNSGKVTMDVHINKMSFCPGEAIQVTACIQNSSSRDIKPKYCLYLKTSFFANGKRKVTTKDLVKEVGEPIPHSAGQNVIRVITAPATTEVSILNCSIIKHEYRLKVYLDVKYQFDPEVKFPIVILPATASPGLGQPPADGADGGYGGYGFEAFGNPSPTSAASEPSAPPPPPSYGTYSLYPPLS
ncbi:arrestin domain-containing protein 3-like [Gadus chalcogrammus]|uniref:arrestin domain-containing protein 3-like n=1 Tax=Gadus chalcogrammus TaxID=1042646 RepID=UPI0024C413EC|nr:arrestin domain-containing protein 3-like [Gadus chalcogrammus]